MQADPCATEWRESLDRLTDVANRDSSGRRREARRSAESRAVAAADEPAPEWPEPRPLRRAAVSPLCPELLPPPLAPWLVDVADRASLPLEAVAAPALVALGTVVGRRVAVRPLEGADWIVPANLWGLVVAPPGFKKSTALTAGLAPLRPLVERAETEYAERERAAAARRIAVEGDLQKARRKGSDAASEIESLLREMDSLRVPRRRYRTSDPTVEALEGILVDNPSGVLVAVDELAGWLQSFERAGREGSRAFYLAAWDGTGVHVSDRVGRGSTRCMACVSVVGTIQPAALAAHVRAARALAGDGLLQRFGLVAWLDDLPPYRLPTGRPDRRAEAAAFEVYRRLDDLLPDGSGEPFEVHFDRDAQRGFDDWLCALEARLRSRGLEDAPAFTAVVGKQRGSAAKLALLDALACHAGQTDVLTRPIPAASLDRALGLVAYFERHAARMWADELHPGLEAARALGRRIERGDVLEGSTVRSIYRKGWSGLSTSEDVHAALDRLEADGWLRVEAVRPQTGRPTCVVRLNPRVYGRTPCADTATADERRGSVSNGSVRLPPHPRTRGPS